MQRRCPSHFGNTRVLPPRDLIDSLIEVDPTIGQHWYWLGEDSWVDRVDGAHYAVLKWAPPDSHTTTWMVARLLWCWENDGFGIKHLKLDNTCGLSRCINPKHWRYVQPLSSRKFKLPDNAGARLVRYEKNFMPSNSVHIVPLDAGYAMCGVTVASLTDVRDVVITCADCVREWFDVYKRPLIEVT